MANISKNDIKLAVIHDKVHSFYRDLFKLCTKYNFTDDEVMMYSTNLGNHDIVEVLQKIRFYYRRKHA